MAWTAVLEIDGVEGETEKTGYEKCIDVMHCSMGIQNHGQLDTKGWSSGRATASEFSFGLKGGAAAIIMEKMCAGGTTIGTVVLKELKSTDDNTLTLFKETTFTDCKITSVSESASDGALDTSNQVTLGYGEKKVEYKAQDTKGGALANKANYHYDFKKSEMIA